MPPFLYLFQVEQELPENLQGAHGPDSEVRFLSYRARSRDRRQLFYPHSSWTQGRNRLLRECWDAEFTYVILGDADLQMELTARAARGSDPWREFERFLLEYEPAVGTPAYAWHLSERWDLRLDAQTLRFFDPLLNAFHREAVPALLPYYDLLDEQCEDYSGSIVCSTAADLYPGRVMQSNRVRVLNPLSQRPYTERLLTKPESLYLESLRDPRLVESYRRQPEWAQLRHPDMGEAHRGRGSYVLPEPALAEHYRLDHPIWVRKRALLAMPREHPFYGDDPGSERAQRWRARRAFSAGPPQGRLRRLWLRSRPVRVSLGLVRSSRLFTPLRRLHAARALLHGHWQRWQRRTQGPSAADLWQTWAPDDRRPLNLPAAGPDVVDLIGHVLDQTGDREVILLDVGTGRGEARHRLQDGVTQRKPVVSIGVDAVQTRGFTWYTGFVLGTVSAETLPLSTILKQYGLADRTLHWVRITEPAPAALFLTLGEHGARCLFLTVRRAPEDPRWAETVAAFTRAGFAVLAHAAAGVDGHPETTFVRDALLKTLLPSGSP
jgi:hypothetical protein